MFTRKPKKPKVERAYDQLHRLIVRRYGRRWILFPVALLSLAIGLVVWVVMPPAELWVNRVTATILGFLITLMVTLVAALVLLQLGPDESDQVEAVIEVLQEQAYDSDTLLVIETRANVSGVFMPVRTLLPLFLLPVALPGIGNLLWQLPLLWGLVGALVVVMIAAALVFEVDRTTTAATVLHALAEYRHPQRGVVPPFSVSSSLVAPQPSLNGGQQAVPARQRPSGSKATRKHRAK